MGTGRHERIDTQRHLCHRCGYDLTGRETGDPCPECATPFDRRPDAPGAEKRSRRGVVYMVLALLVLPVVVPLSFLFLFLALQVHSWLKDAPRHARISYRIHRRHRLIRILVYVWMLGLIAVIWLDAIWPPFMDWW